jgi:hypothetical protein
MTKPANFPERKRQRQISAIARLPKMTAHGKSNDAEYVALGKSIHLGSQRDERTKKDRTARGRFVRAA